MGLKKFLQHYIYKISAFAVIIFILSTGFYFFYSQSNEITKDKKEELQAIADLKAGELVHWINERSGDAYVLSENPLLIDAMQNWISGKNNPLLRDKIIRKLESYTDAFGYEGITVISPSGEILFSAGGHLHKLDPVTRRFIARSVNDKKIHITDFYYCESHKEIHLDLIIPLITRGGKILTLLVLRIKPDNYIYPAIQSWPTPSPTAETLLVRREGDSVLFLNRLRHIKNENLSFKLPLRNREIPAVEAVSGITGVKEGIDYRGVKVLADIRPVPGSPWFLVTKIDKEEIYSDLYHRQLAIVAFMILGIIIFITLFAFIYNYRQADTYLQLYLREKELKEKQEEFRTILYSIGDGVILTDNRGNIKILNKTAEVLTGWSEAEASGKSIDEVFNIVNEETFEKHENPVAKVVNTGLVVGLANHTLLISRGGMRRPIADSGAPVKDEGGDITGVVLVFRDQSSERAAQNRLVEKSNELESIFENMINAFIIWESVFDENGTYVSFRFGKCNRAFAAIAGIIPDDVMGKDVFEVWPETEETWVQVYGDVATTGVSRSFEMYHKPTDGYYYCNAYRPFDSGERICVIFEDITERKASEERLKNILEEKDTLLRELYHRTKNNMQVIFGILSLQAEESDNDEFRLLIQDTNNRILSMSLVHQMLYRSKSLSSVNLDAYITDLVSLLSDSFNVRPEKIDIRLNLEPVSVLIDIAVPCGLILNELISNVFKHAFPGDSTGYLEIKLKQAGNDCIEISVKDNGQGVPEDFDFFRQKSLGLQLIVSIVQQQLNGTVDFTSAGGIKCVIAFKNIKHKGEL